jgi:hypothetical protein
MTLAAYVNEKDGYALLSLRHGWLRATASATSSWIGKGLEAGLKAAKAAARLDLEVSAGWASPLSRGLWGGTVCCFPPALQEAETLTPTCAVRRYKFSYPAAWNTSNKPGASALFADPAQKYNTVGVVRYHHGAACTPLPP